MKQKTRIKRATVHMIAEIWNIRAKFCPISLLTIKNMIKFARPVKVKMKPYIELADGPKICLSAVGTTTKCAPSQKISRLTQIAKVACDLADSSSVYPSKACRRSYVP